MVNLQAENVGVKFMKGMFLGEKNLNKQKKNVIFTMTGTNQKSQK